MTTADLQIKQGKTEAKLEDARTMLEEGLPVDMVSRITGLTPEEIENPSK